MAKDVKYRNIVLLLYPEWENYKEILNKLKELGGKVFYIEHNADDEVSKPHTHVLLSFVNPRRPINIANRLNIDVKFVRKCSDKYKFIRYLIHADNPEKVQYPKSAIVCDDDCLVDLEKAFFRGATLSSGQGFLMLYDFINSNDIPLTLNDIVEYAIKIDALGDVRTYWQILVSAVKEHNSGVYQIMRREGFELCRKDFEFSEVDNID